MSFINHDYFHFVLRFPLVLYFGCWCDCSLLIDRYQEYKSEFITTQKRAFFDAHKAEEWYISFILLLFHLFSFVTSESNQTCFSV